jgi:hypothetical protein
VDRFAAQLAPLGPMNHILKRELGNIVALGDDAGALL